MSGRHSAGFKPLAGLAMLRAMHIRAVPAFFVIFLVALTLAGCGRKSGLDLPPSAAAAPAAHEEKEADVKTISPISKPAKPKPRVVPKRDLPIDILLN
jgi:predicted small lipoprotein YifL